MTKIIRPQTGGRGGNAYSVVDAYFKFRPIGWGWGGDLFEGGKVGWGGVGR